MIRDAGRQFRDYFQGQINEIATQLNPDLWWFDGDWEHSAEEWEAAKVRAMILEKNPKAIINGRLAGLSAITPRRSRTFRWKHPRPMRGNCA